jgi:predicted small lipoprotein YifL
MKLALALLLVFTIAACGRKGPPSPPGPADQVTYPRGYPAY